MDFDEPGWPLLDDFFIAEGAGRTPTTQRRYVRVRDRLTHFLDAADMAPGLGEDSATLLAAEREFHARGAFWQLYGPDELVCCLPGVLQPPWLPDTVAEARTQVSLVGRLLQHLSRTRLIDLTRVRCAYWESEAAVAQARADVRALAAGQEPDAWADDIPSRFRRQGGAHW